MGRQRGFWGQRRHDAEKEKGRTEIKRNRGYFGLSGVSAAKNPPVNARNTGDTLNPWVRKTLGKKGNPCSIPAGKPHGQRSLADYSPWGGKSQM